MNLNSVIDPVRFCSLFNLQPEATLPPSMPCPLCRQGTLRYYADVQCGYWWACDRCNFAGPTLSLYQKLRQMERVDSLTAWCSLVGELGVTPDPHLMTQAAMTEYDLGEHRRQQVEGFWKACQAHLRKQLYPAAKLLSQSGNAGPEHRRLVPLIGSLDRLKFVTLEPLLEHSQLTRKMNNALMLRYEAVPGRTSAVYCLTEFSKAVQLFEEEPGFIGLGNVLAERDICYAVSDPMLYLQIVRKSTREPGLSCPAVCYVKDFLTGGAAFHSPTNCWDRLHHRQVVFWDEQPDTVLVHARKLGDRGYVADGPAVPAKDLLAGRPLVGLFRHWRSALPWLAYLKRELLARSPGQAYMLTQQLGGPLTDPELQELQRICTDEDYRRILALLRGPSQLRIFRYGNEHFTERAGHGWFRNTPAGEVLVADAYLVPTQACVVDGQTILSGEAVFRDVRLTFSASEQQLRKDPADWLTSFFVGRDIGHPTFDHRYRRLLVDMALAASPPKTVQQVDRVSWHDGRQAYVLPRFLVDAKGLQLHAHSQVSSKNIPGAEIMPVLGPPRPSQVARWFPPGPATEATWALLACTLGNLAARGLGRTKSGILVWDGNGLGAHAVGSVRTGLGLLQLHRQAKPADWELQDLIRLEDRHDLPVVLQTERLAGEPWRRWTQQGRPRNTIVCGGLTLALNLALTDDWQLVQATDELPTIPDMLPELDAVVPLYLTWLSRQQFTVPETRPWPLPVFSGLRAALFPNPQLNPTWEAADRILTAAERRLLDWGRCRLWQRLLRVIFVEMQSGHLTMELAPAKGILTHDKAAGRVLVHVGKLVKHLHKVGWFLPPDTALTEAMMTSPLECLPCGSSWSLASSQWHKHYVEWMDAVPRSTV